MSPRLSNLPAELPNRCKQCRTNDERRAASGFVRFTSVAGWRGSVDRAGLRSISLLTGNFTGNLPAFEAKDDESMKKVSVPQQFSRLFPKRINRERIW